ncbi:PucR family transcriptional regulator [Mycolicibacterium baixiangningiae]|uniref:PucR family transcriptional regulator n=1 Tax=Mycolicibacterium baixiangningiae TaxID=2761578 RepID=UPI0018D0D29E|nr:PucR family transcriptional regulator ligand-binding domain-containing protein [Mycolicibacterium baixiangningiae]
MTVTVGDLVETPHLGLEVLSGGAGLGRSVSWTHTSDLPEPWRWITGGELLMTNGLSFPKAAADQEALLTKLDESGVAGLAIGEKMYCPRLTQRFTRRSEQLGFPVLRIRYPLPFVAISRAVAEATLLDQSDRLSRTMRIYDLLRRHIASASPPANLVAALARELGCELHVCDRRTGDPWFPDTSPLAPALREAVVELSESSTNVAAGVYGLPGDGTRAAMLTDIQRHPEAALVVIPRITERVDPIRLQHTATVISLALSEMQLALEHERRERAALMERLLENRIDRHAVESRLGELRLDPPSTVLVVARSSDEGRALTIHNSLWRNGIPYLCTLREGLLYALVPDQSGFEGVLSRALGPSARIGISARLSTISRFPEAVREGSWAFSLASRRDIPVSRYGSEEPWLGLSNVGDAQALVDRVLAPLRTYDEQHQSNLVATLDAYLRHQRSLQLTATALCVHRQTVLYRIKRIAELTGLNLADTDALAALWLALRAAALLDAEDDLRPL